MIAVHYLYNRTVTDSWCISREPRLSMHESEHFACATRYQWHLNSIVAAVRKVESGVWCDVFWAHLNYALCFSYYANKAGMTCEYFVV
jgi:hypothetical protein